MRDPAAAPAEDGWMAGWEGILVDGFSAAAPRSGRWLWEEPGENRATCSQGSMMTASPSSALLFLVRHARRRCS